MVTIYKNIEISIKRSQYLEGFPSVAKLSIRKVHSGTIIFVSYRIANVMVCHFDIVAIFKLWMTAS